MRYIFNDITGLINLSSLNILEGLKVSGIEIYVSPILLEKFPRITKNKVGQLLSKQLIKEAIIDESFYTYYQYHRAKWSQLGYGDISSIYYAKMNDCILVSSSSLVISRVIKEQVMVCSVNEFLPRHISEKAVLDFYNAISNG